ncbi:glycosyltransferase [Bacteroides ovatus]|uniref:glycosyltransferase n=1 Tax=Bacteroides ovatus TaxID=28116 RepID=UPI0031453B81
MATYNGSKYIRQQVESVLIQLSFEDELIISDDGSLDETLQVLQEIGDIRIKIYENEPPHGVVENFENAIKHAVGDYIFLCDQDDVWMPEKVKKVLEAFENYDFVVHNAEMVDGDLISQGIDFFTLRKTRYGYWQNLWKMRYLGCTMAFKRDTLKFILPFPNNILWHDMWAAAILHLKFHGTLINESLMWYRRHGDNASPSGEKSGWSWAFRIKYRWFVFYNSILRIMKIK